MKTIFTTILVVFASMQSLFAQNWVDMNCVSSPCAYSCMDMNVTFGNIPTTLDGEIVGWLWDFGDNYVNEQYSDQLTLESPIVYYTAPGIYTISVTITNDVGETETITNQDILLVEINFWVTSETFNVCESEFPYTITPQDTFLFDWEYSLGYDVYVSGPNGFSQQGNFQFNAPEPGSYFIDVLSWGSGCLSTYQYTLIEMETPNQPESLSGTYFFGGCNNDVYFQLVDEGYTYVWGDGTIGTTYTCTLSPTVNNCSQTVVAINGNGCESEAVTFVAANGCNAQLVDFNCFGPCYTFCDQELLQFMPPPTSLEGQIVSWQWESSDTWINEQYANEFMQDLPIVQLYGPNAYSFTLTMTDEFGEEELLEFPNMIQIESSYNFYETFDVCQQEFPYTVIPQDSAIFEWEYWGGYDVFVSGPNGFNQQGSFQFDAPEPGQYWITIMSFNSFCISDYQINVNAIPCEYECTDPFICPEVTYSCTNTTDWIQVCVNWCGEELPNEGDLFDIVNISQAYYGEYEYTNNPSTNSQVCFDYHFSQVLFPDIEELTVQIKNISSGVCTESTVILNNYCEQSTCDNPTTCPGQPTICVEGYAPQTVCPQTCVPNNFEFTNILYQSFEFNIQLNGECLIIEPYAVQFADQLIMELVDQETGECYVQNYILSSVPSIDPINGQFTQTVCNEQQVTFELYDLFGVEYYWSDGQVGPTAVCNFNGSDYCSISVYGIDGFGCQTNVVDFEAYVDCPESCDNPIICSNNNYICNDTGNQFQVCVDWCDEDAGWGQDIVSISDPIYGVYDYENGIGTDTCFFYTFIETVENVTETLIVQMFNPTSGVCTESLVQISNNCQPACDNPIICTGSDIVQCATENNTAYSVIPEFCGEGDIFDYNILSISNNTFGAAEISDNGFSFNYVFNDGTEGNTEQVLVNAINQLTGECYQTTVIISNTNFAENDNIQTNFSQSQVFTCENYITFAVNPVDGLTFSWVNYYNGDFYEDWDSYVFSNIPSNQLLSNAVALMVEDENGCWGFAKIFDVYFDANCVWPGDCDYNGEANIYDVLNVGIAYAEQSYERQFQSNIWTAQACQDWNAIFDNGVNHKHADCNGDGLINNFDVDVIDQNYGLTHGKTDESQQSADGTPIYIEFSEDTVGVSETVLASVKLGTETQPATNIYGVAFSIYYDTYLVVDDSEEVTFSNCWIGTEDVNLLTLTKVFHDLGRIDVAIVRNDLQNVSGDGEICQFSSVMVDDIEGKKQALAEFAAHITNVRLINNIEEMLEIGFSEQTAKVIVTNTTTNNENIVNEEDLLAVSPNPFKDNLNVQLPKVDDIGIVEIYNVTGQKVVEENIAGKANQINTQNLPNGLYLISIKTNNKIYVAKVEKLE